MQATPDKSDLLHNRARSLSLRSQLTLEHAALAAITLCALGVRLYFAWQPVGSLVARLTPDDTYYYLQIARNIVHGHGVTFDGVNHTNGFHPLWLVLLLPLAGLGREAFLHAALTFGAVLGTGSVVAFWWAMAPLSQRLSVRITATSFYAFNPAVLYTAVNGLETSLSVLLLIILFGLAIRWREQRAHPYRFWVVVGIVAGLAMLARTDNVLFVLPLLAAMTILSRDIRPSLVAAGCALVVVSPWLLWNLVEFGTIQQTSGEAAPYAMRVLFDPLGVRPRSDFVLHGIAQLKKGFLVEVPEAYFFARPTLAVFASALLAATALAASGSADARRLLIRHAPVLVAMSAGALMLIGVHAGYRWFNQRWYYVPAVPLAALWLALALDAISGAWTSFCDRQRVLYLAAAPALLSLALVLSAQTYASVRRWDPGSYFWQRDMLAAGLWLRSNSPQDARVAGLNAGVVAYFGDRTTTNLDGVVNNNSLEAVKRHQLLAYLDSLAPMYVVDFDPYLFGPFLPIWGGDVRSRLTLEAEFTSNGFLPFRIYRYHPIESNVESHSPE